MASSVVSTLNSVITICQTMVDDGVFLLPSMSNGARCTLVIGADEERVDFSVKSDGTVNLIMASSNVVANADTDTKFCVGIAVVNPVTIKNRLGAVKVVTGSIWYA